MSLATGLLRCPFCYSEAEFGEVTGQDHPDFGGHFINCTNERCQACIGLRYAGKEDPRPLLAEQWNRRANPEPSSLADDEDERGFTPSDYAHTAALLRSSEALRARAQMAETRGSAQAEGTSHE